MNKTSVTIIAALGIIALGAMQMTSLSQQRWSQRKIEKTPRQKEHGKFFRHGGKSLLELADERTGDVTVVVDSPLTVQSVASSSTEPLDKSFEKAFCNADAVVVGLLKSEAGQFNENNTFVFTEYDLDVEQIIKENSKKSVQIGTNIIVARDGGRVTIDGRSFRAVLADFQQFEVGDRLLLFLRYVPSTDSYLAYADGSFKLQQNSVLPYGGLARKEINSDPLTFLNSISQMATSDCAK